MLHKHSCPPACPARSKSHQVCTWSLGPHLAHPTALSRTRSHLAAPRRTWAAHPDRFGDNGFTRRRIPCARLGTSDPANTADSRLALPLNLPGLGETDEVTTDQRHCHPVCDAEPLGGAGVGRGTRLGLRSKSHGADAGPRVGLRRRRQIDVSGTAASPCRPPAVFGSFAHYAENGCRQHAVDCQRVRR